jgi:hypothetical protein
MFVDFEDFLAWYKNNLPKEYPTRHASEEIYFYQMKNGILYLIFGINIKIYYDD